MSGKMGVVGQKDESIMIGDLVEITIVEIRGDKVRLGVSADKNISVHRKEVWLEIQKEKLGVQGPDRKYISPFESDKRTQAEGS